MRPWISSGVKPGGQDLYRCLLRFGSQAREVRPDRKRQSGGDMRLTIGSRVISVLGHNLDRLSPSHSLPKNVPYGTGSQKWSATIQPNTLLVFVHGFGGNAVHTWSDFPSRILGEAKYADADIVFFGFDGLRSRAALSAGLLRQALDSLTNDVAYDRIVLVGHSLGCVVSRMALVDAVENRNRWVSKVNLVFFAPAHSGARIEALFASLSSALAVFRALPDLGRLICPVLLDLEMGSPTLAKLSSQVMSLTVNEHQELIARVVAFGSADRVVEPVSFARDPLPIVVARANHSGICKPTPWFTAPAEILEAIL